MDPFNESFNRSVEKVLADFFVPGMSIGIIEGDEVFTKGFGFADLEKGIPATPETLYHVGSISKSLLATTWTKYIQEQQEKKFSLQSKLVDLIGDDFELSDSYTTRKVTLEDAFCHRTGMTRNDLVYGGEVKTMRDVVRCLRYMTPSDDPNGFIYTNPMYTASTHALEIVTGEPVGKVMKEVLFQPLGMCNTYTNREDAVRNSCGNYQLHHGYGRDGDKYFADSPQPLDCAGAAGFAISNVEDMTKYLQAWMGNGTLSKNVRDEVSRPRMIRCKTPFNEGYTQYGLGICRFIHQGVELIGHNGQVTGYTGIFYFIPQLNLGFVALGNAETAFAAALVLLLNMIDEKLNVEQSKRADYSRYYQYLFSMVRTKKTLEQATKIHYPELTTVVPLVVPLKAHTGTFSHPAYKSLTFVEKDGYLEAREPNRTWRTILQLHHISSASWIGYKLNGSEERQGQIAADIKVKVKYDIHGNVMAWGFELEPEQQPDRWGDRMTWFEKV